MSRDDKGVLNMKFGKLFYQDVTDEQKILINEK